MYKKKNYLRLKNLSSRSNCCMGDLLDVTNHLFWNFGTWLTMISRKYVYDGLLLIWMAVLLAAPNLKWEPIVALFCSLVTRLLDFWIKKKHTHKATGGVMFLYRLTVKKYKKRWTHKAMVAACSYMD
jgi:hypothetical protein